MTRPGPGGRLRDWRRRRRLTQRALADRAGVDVRVVSAAESGLVRPSRDTILRLADWLEIPLRDRNAILMAAGYDAAFPMRAAHAPLPDGLSGLVGQGIGNHLPNPALALDRHWGIVASNDVLRRLIAGVDPTLLQRPSNWVRIMLHPAGLAPRITNLRAWSDHMSLRLRRHFERTADTVVADLLEEIGDYPLPQPSKRDQESDPLAVPLRLMTLDGLLTFYNMTSSFDAALDVTLSELTVEALCPADEGTASILRQMAAVAA